MTQLTIEPKKVIRITIILALTIFASVARADCPPCYNNQVPLEGHGGQPGDGRRKINVRIGTSWGETTDRNIWNGVFGLMDQNDPSQNILGAVNQWNIATDSASPPNKTLYYFVGHQTDDSDVDIVITKALPGYTGCGEIDLAHGRPYVMILSPSASTWPVEWIQALVAHELGHAIGLANSDEGSPGCFSTIMNGHKAGSCEPVNPIIFPDDVAASNKNANPTTRPGCEATAPSISGNPESCGDPCCGDLCCGDPCCGDPYCDQDCYLSCDSYCYGCEAWDPYDPGDCMWWGECYVDCYEYCY